MEDFQSVKKAGCIPFPTPTPPHAWGRRGLLQFRRHLLKNFTSQPPPPPPPPPPQPIPPTSQFLSSENSIVETENFKSFSGPRQFPRSSSLAATSTAERASSSSFSSSSSSSSSSPSPLSAFRKSPLVLCVTFHLSCHNPFLLARGEERKESLLLLPLLLLLLIPLPLSFSLHPRGTPREQILNNISRLLFLPPPPTPPHPKKITTLIHMYHM